ncbi:MAG: hypothetical protein J0H12_07180 [Candidatus Paracaedimonas acanthamoebae]|uniref:Uncharacterized protein n=1 Tax=Candidatus Paracaedimonas acanthamoebae TaxID=244581 RepID=A0A8J7PSB2_9PROT|nr:hypothetical protein [Candidatus Paracaedimonas acanthamoebae]
MFKMRRYALFVIGSLLGSHLSYSSDVDFDVCDGDLELAKSKSLISGATLEDLHSGKAAITIGFKEIGGGIKHAYLVFETPETNKNSENIICVQGVHFGGVGGYYEPDTVCGAVSGGGKGIVYEESTKEVIQKFFRAKQIKIKKNVDSKGIKYTSSEEVTILDGTYTKHKSFIVSAVDANNALLSIGSDKSRGTFFSLKGWGITDKDKTYNCTRYAEKLLERAGIKFLPPKLTDLIIDHRYLISRIVEYESRSLSNRNGIEVIDPPSAEDLLASYDMS